MIRVDDGWIDAHHLVDGHMLHTVAETVRREGAKATIRWLSRYALSAIVPRTFFARITHGSSTVLKSIQGNRMYLNPLDPGLQSELLVLGVHERKSTEILKREMRRGMKVMDIGANIGYYAMIEARIIGEKGKVFAIEPEPSNFELLSKNIELNNLNHIIEVFKVAISDTDGLSYLFLGDRSNIPSLFEESDAALLGRGKIPVKTMTISTFLNTNSVDEVDFIRMDIEGFEYRIINGMTSILREMSPELFIEFHPNILKRAGISIVTLLKKLESFGYIPKYVLTKRTERVLQPSMKELSRDKYILEQPFHAFLAKA